MISKVHIVRAMATVSGDIDSLMTRLTIVPSGYEGEGKSPLYLYNLRSDGTIEIPRALVTTSGVDIDWKWDTIDWEFNGTLRPKQVALVEKFNKLRDRNRYGSIIKANTGDGKTVVGLYLASQFKGRVLIVVPLDALVKQWKERILQFTNLKEDEVGLIRGNTCQVKGKKIVIAMLHSLAQREYSEIYDSFKVVIFDEIHTISTQTFHRVAGLFNCYYRIGLSATPRRKDGAEAVFLWHIGNVITADEQRDIVPTIYIAKYHGEDARETYYTTPYGKFLFSRYLNHIVKQNDRNSYIVSLLLKAYNKGRKILVLTDRVDHVGRLKKMLKGVGVTDVSVMVGDTKEPPKSVVLATYGSAGMGVDIPQLDTLIFATPRVDIEQAVGRLLRVWEGKKNPLVIDIVDVKSGSMIGYYKARRRMYDKLGFKVVSDEN